MDRLNKWIFYLVGCLVLVGCSESDELCFSNEPTASVSSVTAWNVLYDPSKGIQLLEDFDSISVSDFALWVNVEPSYFLSNSSGCQIPLLLESIREIDLTIINEKSLFDSLVQEIPSSLLVIEGAEKYAITDLESINEIFRYQFHLFLKPEGELEKNVPLQFRVRLLLNDQREFFATTKKVIFF